MDMSKMIVQFPNSVPVVVNVNVTLNFLIVNMQPQCNGHICWQASLLHLRPKFSVTVMIYYNGNGLREIIKISTIEETLVTLGENGF